MYYHIIRALINQTGSSFAPCTPCRLAHFIIDKVLGIRCLALRPTLEQSLFVPAAMLLNCTGPMEASDGELCLETLDLYTLFAFPIDVHA
jgi:hypothetical protein